MAGATESVGWHAGHSVPVQRKGTISRLYPSFCPGAHGAIAVILAAAPELGVRLWDAVQAGCHTEALGLHARLLRIWNAIAGDNLPVNVKCALAALQGRPAGLPPPMAVSSEAQRDAIRAALEAAGVAVQHEV
jgi:4-hydroxy-tetrahydrodipicolinate synthase